MAAYHQLNQVSRASAPAASPPPGERRFVVLYAHRGGTCIDLATVDEIARLYRNGEQLEQVWFYRSMPEGGLVRCSLEELPRTRNLRPGFRLWVGRDLVATITADVRLCAFCCEPATGEIDGVGRCAAHTAASTTSSLGQCDFCTAPADCEFGDHILCSTHAIIEAERAAAECQA